MMTIRKLIANFILAFIILPIISFAKYFSNEISSGNWYNESFQVELLEFIHVYGYFLPSILCLIFILWPFQIIKDRFRSKQLSFINKTFIFFSLTFVIMIIASLSIYGMVRSPWWKNYTYLVFAIVFSLFCTTFLYFAVDRHVASEKEKK